MKGDPAVRLCVTCGELKSADQFEPGRRKCVACQTKQGQHLNGGHKQPSQVAVFTRARDRALRRLATEHVDTYRKVKAQRLAAVPAALPPQRAQRRAVSQTLSELGRRYRERYRALYEQEVARARLEPLPVRRGRPPGGPNRLSLASASLDATWRRQGPAGSRPNQQTQDARRRAEREAVRLRAAELFQQGRSTTTVAADLGVARQTAVSWQARWREGGVAALRSRGPSRQPAIPDSELPAIERALLKGAKTYRFDSDLWTSARVAVAIQRITGVQLGPTAARRLLRERLGWRFQPATGATAGTAGAQPLPTPASATDSLTAVAAATLANLENQSAGRPGLARSNRPASSADRRDAIAQAWRDEPGITDTALAERFGVSRRTVQRDTQALQERGIQRRPTDRRRRSHRTRAHYGAIYRRFLAWLADELGRPPIPDDLSGYVLARWIAQRASVGGHGGGGLSSASLRLECSALRQLARHAGRPELAASLHTSRQQAPPPETISPAQYERLLLEPDLTTAVGVRDRATIRLLGDVGLRPSEVCALTFGDIVWSADGQVPVQLEVAWGKGRVVQLTPETSSALADWLPYHPDWQPDGGRRLPAEAPLFVVLGPPKPARQAITETGLLRQVLRHAEQAEIPAHLRYPYVLRHYWATQEVGRGITVAQLQARGGWRDRRSAQAYFQRPPAASALAAVLGLDHRTPPEH